MQTHSADKRSFGRIARRMLVTVAVLFLVYEGLMTFLVVTFAGPNLAAYPKSLTKLVLTGAVLLAEQRQQFALVLLAATASALLALTWWKQLPPTYHNWAHFRAEALPQLALATLAGVVFATNRSTGGLYE